MPNRLATCIRAGYRLAPFVTGRVQGGDMYSITAGDRLATNITVPVSKSRNIPEVVLVRRWAVGVLRIWRGEVGWVKGGANGVSLQAT